MGMLATLLIVGQKISDLDESEDNIQTNASRDKSMEHSEEKVVRSVRCRKYDDM